MRKTEQSISKKQIRKVVVMGIAAIMASAISVSAQNDSGRGRHAQFYVTPTPGNVVIDGKLNDWDLSGQIEMFVVEATRSTQTAKIAAMYDDKALYLSGEINDPTPMMNRHDPKVNPSRGWDADALQFRFVTDPEAEYPVQESAFKYRGKDAVEDTRDDIVHLLLWHYTDGGSANLQMHLGMGYRVPRPEWAPHGLVPADKFEGTYRKWEDESGYTFEYRIPWSTLGVEKPLRGGDKVAGTMQVNWSRPDGLKTGGGGAWAYDGLGSPGFPFQSAACWGRMIFSESGNVPRELVEAGVPPERTLPLEFAYEIPENSPTTIQLFDQDNQAVRIIVPQEERPGGRNVERWDGLDDQGNLLPAGEYRWRGIYSTEPIQAKYRFSAHNSGKPAHPTDDNKGGWGADHGRPTTVAAFDKGMLLAWSGSEYGWGMIRTNLDGRKQWGSKHGAQHLATDGSKIYFAGDHGFSRSAEVRMLEIKDSRPTRLDNGIASFVAPVGGTDDENQVSGLAYGNGRLYISYQLRNLIAVYDTKNGKLLSTWDVPTPGRLAVRPDGSVAAVSVNQVFAVVDGKATAWLKSHLDKPQGIAVGTDGKVYVANQGKLQNVSVFASEGKYLRSIGREGGRPAMGKYDSSGIYMPGGIDLDKDGFLWVAETTDFPKRISVWNTKSGELANEFFGSSSYFAYGYIDPDRPGEMYAHNVLWDIDWGGYKVEPKTTIWRATEPNMAPAPLVDAYTSGGGFRIITIEDGRQFGWGGAGTSRGKVFYWRDGDIFRPFAGMIDPWKDEAAFPGLEDYRKQLEKEWDAERVAQHRRPRIQFWYDVNRDGKVTSNELTPLKEVGKLVWLNKDLSILTDSGYLLKPTGKKDDDLPVYDLAAAEETPWVGNELFSGYVMPDGHGNVYTLRHRKGPSLLKWTSKGEIAWNYPGLIRWHDSLNLPTIGPGRLWGMTSPMGVAGDFIVFQTYFGANQLFRNDGMYVGCLLQDGRNQTAIGANTGQPEGQSGSFMKLKINGEDRYFLIGGGQDSRVWEVLGLDTIKDLPGGTYIHTEEQVAKAREAKRQYEAAMDGQGDIRIFRGRKALEEAQPVGKDLEGGRGFKARVAYDDKNLYVRFDVTVPHGLINGQANPQIIFRGGNCLDIQIATDSKADPNRKKPVSGDMRLLVTRKDNKPFAMLYRPKMKGFKGERTVLVSPTGEEPFDDISEVDVDLEYEKTSTGFTATVTVPLDTLGFHPKSGDTVKMDLGYIFGNSRGVSTLIRSYVNNNSFSANVVDDIPNESRLEPAEWGTATFE